MKATTTASDVRSALLVIRQLETEVHRMELVRRRFGDEMAESWALEHSVGKFRLKHVTALRTALEFLVDGAMNGESETLNTRIRAVLGEYRGGRSSAEHTIQSLLSVVNLATKSVK